MLDCDAEPDCLQRPAAEETDQTAVRSEVLDVVERC